MKAKRFLIHSISLLALFFGMYILLFYFQLGAPLEAEWWVNDIFKYKDYKARNTVSKKIMVFGGSNVLFGINSQVIAKKTGYSVVNMGTHGGLDINYIYYKIKQHINEGDIVVLPLEFEFYTHAGEVTEWFSQNIQAWGKDYLKNLSLRDLVKFIISADPARVFSGILEQITSSQLDSKTKTEIEILTELDTIWTQEGAKWRGYSYKSLNKYGDINVDKIEAYSKDPHYLNATIKVAPYFIDIYRKIENLVQQNNGTLFLTYPVTTKNKHFDLANNESLDRVTNLENKLKLHGITIQCNASMFNLDKELFFDNRYHPNKNGAFIRSSHLSDCLNSLINGH